MHAVNLIAKRRALQVSAKRVARAGSIGVLAALLVMSASSGVLVAQLRRVDLRAAQLADRAAELRPVLRRFEQAQRKQEQWLDFARSYLQARQSQDLWWRWLQAIQGGLPRDGWITLVDTQALATGKTLLIDGRASSEASVSRFFANLAAAPHAVAAKITPRLNYIRRVTQDGVEVYEFQVAVPLESTPRPEAPPSDRSAAMKPVAHILSALAVVVLLATAATVFSLVILFVGAQRTHGVQQRLGRRQSEVERAASAQINVIAEEERAGKMMERLRHLKETREDRDYSVEFAKSIAQAAASSGNSVMAIQVAPPGTANDNPITALSPAAPANAAPGGALKVPGVRLIEVTLRGTFDTALRFTENLNRFPHIVSIEELRLQPDGARGAGQKNELMMKLRLATMPVRLRRVTVPDEGSADGLFGKSPTAGRS